MAKKQDPNIIGVSSAQSSKGLITRATPPPHGESEGQKQIQKQLSCIYSKDEADDEPRRRGKKKKKNKNQPDTTTFRPNQDPETQVATLTPDSTNQSQRTSLVANGANLMSQGNKQAKSTRSSIDRKSSLRNTSFLDESLLSQLRRGLNIDVIEANFRTLMHMALKEAMRNVPMIEKGPSAEPEAIRGVREALNLPEVDHEKWLKLPRKYTRMVSRFELPIDSSELLRLTPVEYLSKYVQVSNYRKQLYHRIFLKFIPDVRIDDFGEINLPDGTRSRGGSLADGGGPSIADLYISKRFIGVHQLGEALCTALHPNGTDEVVASIMDILSINVSLRRNQRKEGSQRRGGAGHKQGDNGGSGYADGDEENENRRDNEKKEHDDDNILPPKLYEDDSPNGKFNIRSDDVDGKIDNNDIAASDDTEIKSGQKSTTSGTSSASHNSSSSSSSSSVGYKPEIMTYGDSKKDDNDEFARNEIKINFRTWCGIVAFSERLTTNIGREQDARHEIEITDFESLDRRLNGIGVHPKLKELLYIIKN